MAASPRIPLTIIGGVASAIAALLTGQLVAIPSAAAATASAGTPPSDTRNTVERAGNAPQWIQSPHLRRTGQKRFTVTAKLYVEPFRNPRSKQPRQVVSRQDQLHLRVVVAKRTASTPKRPRSLNLLPKSATVMRSDKTIKVTRQGILTVRQPLNRRAANQVRAMSFRQRRAAIAVSVAHWKDTFQRSPVWAFKQITTGDLTRRPDSRTVQRKRHRAAKQQHRALQRPPSKRRGQVRAQWAGESPAFNNVYFQNFTPFEQQLNWNPNLQCMYTGGVTNDPSDAVTETIGANSTLMVQYTGSSSESAWPGLNGGTAGLNAPGTSASWSGDLVKSASAAGQNLLGSLAQTSTYSEAGAVAAVGNAALTFLTKLIGNAPSSTCNTVATYPELFGLSTTVTGIGTNGTTTAAQAALPNTSGWNQTVAGGADIGNAGTSQAAGPQFVSTYLQQMLGAQTNYTYYWNGGQPAPMVSNNAASGTFTGGAGTVQDGLMQVVAPNPGNPSVYSGCSQGGNWSGCSYSTYGSLQINLVYLTNPTFAAGLQTEGGTPELTVSEDTAGNYNLTCDLAGMDATLYLPFGSSGTTAIGSATLAQQPTDTAGTTPQDANWMVNFFGVSAQGDYLYSYETSPNGISTPALSANAQQQIVSIADAASSGGQTTATGVVTPADLAAMTTVTGESGVPVRFGCNATPTITLPDLAIDAADNTTLANAWGNDWPMPTTGGAGWPTGYWGSNYTYQTNWSWQTNVTNLNLTFMGFPASSDSDPADGMPPGSPLAVAAVAGDTDATISWSPPTITGSSPITGYTVTAAPGGQTCSALAPTTSCSIAGLTNGTAYSFSVAAYSQAGSSAPSLPSSSVTPGFAPGAPTDVTATSGVLSAGVSWAAPGSIGSSPIIGYTVTAAPGGRTCSALAPSTSCIVAGLSAGTSYSFTVTAENANGTGSSSASSNTIVPVMP